MKIIWLLLIAIFSYANEYEWIGIYRSGGVQALEQKINEVLQTKNYWQEVLKNQDTRFGYYENLKYLFVATKDAPTLESPNLKLYALENNQWVEKLNTKSLVGSKGGHKQKEGDLATPIGVYSLQARLSNLDQYYGPLAFSTSYPNLYDKLQKRTGYGIWIHGMPLNGNREELNTRGCIAIENSLLTSVDRIIDYRNTLLITFADDVEQTKKEDLATILADLFQWKEAWAKNDIEAYLAFYDKDFIRYDGQKFGAFEDTKRRIFQKGEEKEIKFAKINVSPYPNEENKKLFKISYHQDYKAFLKGTLNYYSNGNKELYVELKNGKMQILVEQ